MHPQKIKNCKIAENAYNVTKIDKKFLQRLHNYTKQFSIEFISSNGQHEFT